MQSCYAPILSVSQENSVAEEVFEYQTVRLTSHSSPTESTACAPLTRATAGFPVTFLTAPPERLLYSQNLTSATSFFDCLGPPLAPSPRLLDDSFPLTHLDFSLQSLDPQLPSLMKGTLFAVSPGTPAP